MNKLYISPEFEILRVEITEDVIMASPVVEDYTSYVPPEPGDWGDPTFDPNDDGLDW